ncbi:MAG TPA: hypothetical protein VFG24_09735 [Nitrosopumilaceae archaeon]|nr:hypothetical protein [Nitrosopumilaceae archaeon]
MSQYKMKKLFTILTALTLVFATATTAQINNSTPGNPIQSIDNVLAKLFGGLVKTAQADPGANVFELDGNIITNAATSPPDDWDHIFADSVSGPCALLSTLPSSFIAGTVPFCKHDDPTPDASYFSTGSKDTSPISSGKNPWNCGTISNPTGKDNLLRGFAFAAKSPSTGDTLFFVGGIREAKTQGAADWGVWFLKDKTVAPTCTSADTSNHPFTGKHQDGDELVTVEFTIGGTVGTINVFRWNGDDSTGSLGSPTTFAVTCNGSASGSICGIANGGTTISPGPFPATTLCADPSTTNCLKVNQFFEVGIDATALFHSVCFSNILIDTRSSPSSTSTIKDFTLGNFITCNSSTIPTKQAFDASGNPLSTVGTTNVAGTPISGVRVGSTITYKFTEQNTSMGPLDITNVTAIDSQLGNLGAPTSGDTGDHILHPGQTWTWTKTFTVTTCSPVTNTVTFTGQVPLLSGAPAPVEQASITVNVICPATEATKHAYSTAADAAAGTNPIDNQNVTRGATIYYLITEKNTSSGNPNISQIKNVMINDTLVGLGGIVSPDSGDTNSNGLLDVGETWKWIRSFTTSSANCNGVINNVSLDGAMVLDGSAAPHETASVTVNVTCPVVKITEFGYTNAPTDLHPTSGIVSGTTVFTAKLHNFGTGSTTVTASLTSPTTASTVSCSPSSLPGISLASGADATLSMTCTYTNAASLTVVSAHLEVTYTLGSGPGKASGSPANISFTIQSD